MSVEINIPVIICFLTYFLNRIEGVKVNDIQDFCNASPVGIKNISEARLVQDFIKHLERRFTLNYDILEVYQGITDNEQEIWKLELYDHATEITMIACQNWLISHNFLKIVRELFTTLLLQVQPELMNLDQGLLRSIWKVVNFEASRCKQKLNASEDFQTIVRDAYILMKDSPAFEPSYFKGAGGGDLSPKRNSWDFNKDKNIVIEIAWLVANHVAAVCHAVSKQDYNFWPNFIRIFNKFYLLPLSYEWNNPSRNEDYQFLLGGFDYKVEYEKLGFCATQAFKMTMNLVPFHKKYENNSSDSIVPWGRQYRQNNPHNFF
ncbi:unnamed protein product [Allacma fusca]|uniref:Uncharacterized protein n=1 Tax=Allacma fusca TaxID=39272 RepID=A0A8J2PU92_9HEXA|nr:unnamed protein product [Allacma fusca]